MALVMEVLLVLLFILTPILIICGAIDIIVDEIIGMGTTASRILMALSVFLYGKWLSLNNVLPIEIARAVIDNVGLL